MVPTRYEDRIKELADAITPHVQFDSVDEARTFVLSYKQPMGSDIARQVDGMAENFVVYAERFSITTLIADIGINIGTKLSALREAIRLCAQRFVARYDQEELVSLGLLDSSATSALA